MLLKHVVMGMLKGAVMIGTFIFSQTVKLQSKHLTTVKFTLSWSGTASSPCKILAECNKVGFEVLTAMGMNTTTFI
jgi:hypothetical protein